MCVCSFKLFVCCVCGLFVGVVWLVVVFFVCLCVLFHMCLCFVRGLLCSVAGLVYFLCAPPFLNVCVVCDCLCVVAWSVFCELVLSCSRVLNVFVCCVCDLMCDVVCFVLV